MFNGSQLVAGAAASVLMFASFGSAHADDANRYFAEVRADLEMAEGVDIEITNHTDIRASAEVGSDQPGVIEEIVVVGKEKWRLPNLGGSLRADPVVSEPGRIDWQFLPMFDSEQAYPYLDQFHLSDEIRRAGFVQLFRVRFGR